MRKGSLRISAIRMAEGFVYPEDTDDGKETANTIYGSAVAFCQCL